MKLLIRSFGHRRRTVGVSGPGVAPPPGPLTFWRSLWRSTTDPAAGCRSSPAWLGRPDWRSRKTLTEAADEAGMSRRYGGIHFYSGDQQGRALGRLIGYNDTNWARDYLFKGQVLPPPPD